MGTSSTILRLTLFAALGLGACGDGTDEPEPTDSSEPTDPSDAPAPTDATVIPEPTDTNGEEPQTEPLPTDTGSPPIGGPDPAPTPPQSTDAPPQPTDTDGPSPQPTPPGNGAPDKPPVMETDPPFDTRGTDTGDSALIIPHPTDTGGFPALPLPTDTADSGSPDTDPPSETGLPIPPGPIDTQLPVPPEPPDTSLPEPPEPPDTSLPEPPEPPDTSLPEPPEPPDTSPPEPPEPPDSAAPPPPEPTDSADLPPPPPPPTDSAEEPPVFPIPTDTGQSGESDTCAPTDSAPPTDTSVPPPLETAAPLCSNDYPDVLETWTDTSSLGPGAYTLCLPTTDFGEMECNANADLQQALDDLLTPDCIYDNDSNDTGWFFPEPINWPCDDGLHYIEVTECGPFDPGDGSCCFEVQLGQAAIGRPLLTPDGPRLATTEASSTWLTSVQNLSDHPDADDIAARWLYIAHSEHASVASFARVVLDLLAHGAPANLVTLATQAQADEIVHAQLAYDIASRFQGAAVGPGRLNLTGIAARTTLTEVLTAAICEGCVGETLAAHEASVARDGAQDPQIRHALTIIAQDEAKHAALAWKIVKWILTAHPDLRPLAITTFDRAQEAIAQRDYAERLHGVESLGLLSPDSARSSDLAALSKVVTPCRQQLGLV